MKQNMRIHKAEPNTGVLNYAHLLDAPAGKHGFVQVRKGHFYFEDGTRARFLGFNVAARSNTPDHETAEKMAKRFASMGVNVIRLHAADAPIGEEPGSWSSCQEAPLLDYEKGNGRNFHTEGLDRFDYFAAKLKEKGIYLHIDLIVARDFREGDGLDYPGSPGSCLKRYPMYNQRMMECHALSENGAHETAVTLFRKEDCPSWLYEVKMGATTMWENWNGIKPDGTMLHPGLNSMNHYAYGSIGDWMYRKIGGINQLEPGYRRFCVKPMLVRGIEESRTSLESPYGEIVSAVSCRDGKITVRVKVPANTTAVICLPEREDAIEAGSGEYVYEYGTETSLRELRFTLDSTLGDILDEPEGRRLMEEMAPELMANPMIEYARRMTLAEGISAAPEIRAVYEAVLKVLNR